MLKILIIAFLILSLLPANVHCASNSIVINSFRAAGEKTTDEFVELYNSGPVTINIAGWQLAKKTASGTKYNLINSFPSVDIAPDESFVIGHTDSTEPIDLKYATAYSISEDNTIILFSDPGKTVVDKVGFGKAGEFEGSPLPAAKTETWARKGHDRDDNLSDFVNQTALMPKDYSGLCITEIMLAPSDGEEWIEIYNSEVTKDISGLVIGDMAGSLKTYKVPSGTIIEEGKYLVLYAKETGLSLNNDGDGVSLIDQTGAMLDSSGISGSGSAGSSYAFDGEKWQWTKSPTPGSQNIITPETLAEKLASLKSRKKTTKSNGPIKSKKGQAEKAAVKGAVDAPSDDSIFNDSKKLPSSSDTILGIILIALAILGGIAYTLYVNKEKLIAVFNQEREGYEKNWSQLGQKMHRWRDFSVVRRLGSWKNSIRKRFSGWPRHK